jgi:cellulose synthase/poly-beta-1,6-N-acetylglucosamine synthase-like glycosyltransferase
LPGYYVVVGSVVFGLILFFSFCSHVQSAFALKRTRPRHWQGGALPRVSLVIPSFNEEAVLWQTYLSVLALDYPAEAIAFLYIRMAPVRTGPGRSSRPLPARTPRCQRDPRRESLWRGIHKDIARVEIASSLRSSQ